MLLHSNRIIYNDLKPDNICFKSKINSKSNSNYSKDSNLVVDDLVECDFSVLPFETKLLDFSISTIVEESNKDFSVNYITGTTNFQAPETMMSKADGRLSDIWSLGVSMFVFLSNVFPFDGDSELVVQLKTMKGEFSYPEYFDNQVKSLLSSILTIDSKKRTSDLSSLIKILETWL
jgi:serine/threonine protein kinase